MDLPTMKLRALQLCFLWLLAASWNRNRGVDAMTFFNDDVQWPMRIQQDGVYTVLYRQYDAPPDAVTRFRWVMDYISRGSNIEFVDSHDYGKGGLYLKTSNRTGPSQCYSSYFWSVDEPLDVFLSEECSTAELIQLLVQVLGFFPDVTRLDRDNYISIKPESLRSYSEPTDRANTSSPYDVLSVLHPRLLPYREGFVVRASPEVSRLAKNTRMFLTACDWKVLNERYPGVKRAAPTCKPNVLPKVLVPSDTFVKLKGREEAMRLCYEDPSLYFEDLMCIIPHGREYPDVPFDEVRYCGSATVSPDRLELFCSKVTANTKHITQEECNRHCMESCPKNFPYKSIRECLKTHYPRCRQLSSCAQKTLLP